MSNFSSTFSPLFVIVQA